MLYFFIGVIFTLFAIWLYLKIFTDNFLKSLEEAALIKKDLEILYKEYERLTAGLTKDFEIQINQGKGVENLDYSYDTKEKQDVGKVLSKTNIEYNNTGGNKGAQKRSKTRNHSNPKSKSIVKKNNSNLQHKEIIELAAMGWPIKKISQHLNIGQDQVAMIIQLYNK